MCELYATIYDLRSPRVGNQPLRMNTRSTYWFPPMCGGNQRLSVAARICLSQLECAIQSTCSWRYDTFDTGTVATASSYTV